MQGDFLDPLHIDFDFQISVEIDAGLFFDCAARCDFESSLAA